MDLLFLDNADTDDILSELHNPIQYQGYLQVMAFFSGYSWRNVYLIYKQMPLATKLADFDTWKKTYGRSVKQGAKTIKINAPVEQKLVKRFVEKKDPTTGVAMLDDSGKRIMEEVFIAQPPKFKPVRLLDVSQTNGNPLPMLAGDVVSDDSLQQAFMDVLSAICADGTKADIKSMLKQIIADRLELAVSDKNNFLANSVMYVVCRRFGIDSGLTEVDPTTAYIVDTDTIEIISKQSGSLISTIEDRFALTCKERDLDPMTLPKAIKPLPVVEPTTVSTAEQPTEEHTPVEELPEDKTLTQVQPNPSLQATPMASSETQPNTSTLDTPSIPPPIILPENIASVDIYRLSASEAEKHSAMPAYEASRQVDIICANVIDEAIQYHKEGTNRYDLATPAEVLLEEYGKNRMMWVLSKHMLARPKGFTKDSIAWADKFINDKTGSGDEIPTFFIKTHPAVLDAFVTEIRTVLSQKRSFNHLMHKAKIKSDAHNNSSG